MFTLKSKITSTGTLFGLVLSLLPSAYMFLILYPGRQLGFLGRGKGPMTFLLVLLFTTPTGDLSRAGFARSLTRVDSRAVLTVICHTHGRENHAISSD